MTKTMAQEIAELHDLDVPALVARFEALFGKPPRSKHKTWLLKRCAHQIQVARCGGLSEVARRRLAELMAEIDLPLSTPDTTTGMLKRSKHQPELGDATSIERDYKNQRAVLRVDAGAFAVTLDGADLGRFRSISAAAGAVCGQHVNGRLWWRLIDRRRKA